MTQKLEIEVINFYGLLHKTTLDIKVFLPKLAKIFLSRISVFYRKVKMCLWEMRRTWVIVLPWLGSIKDSEIEIDLICQESSSWNNTLFCCEVLTNLNNSPKPVRLYYIETQVVSFSTQCHNILLSDELEDILRRITPQTFDENCTDTTIILSDHFMEAIKKQELQRRLILTKKLDWRSSLNN